MPNMYARGILFGKMVLELGDTCIAKNEKHGLYCDLEFKTKVPTVMVSFLWSPGHDTYANDLGLLFWSLQRAYWSRTQEFVRCWRSDGKVESCHGN